MIHSKNKITAARHIIDFTTRVHHLLESLDLDLVDSLVRTLLCVDAIQDLLLCQNIENRANSLEVLRRVILK